VSCIASLALYFSEEPPLDAGVTGRDDPADGA